MKEKNKRWRNNLEVLVCDYQEYQKDTEKKKKQGKTKNHRNDLKFHPA